MEKFFCVKYYKGSNPNFLLKSLQNLSNILKKYSILTNNNETR